MEPDRRALVWLTPRSATSNGSTRLGWPRTARTLAWLWGDWTLSEPQAGALGRAEATVENAGSVRWGHGIEISYR